MRQYLSTFDRLFNLDDVEFMHSQRYKELANVTRSFGTDHIPWWNRTLDYPPK